MTSQKSANKNSICLLSLIREDLRHKHWMIALSILGSFLAGPVTALFFVGRLIEDSKRYVIVGNAVYNQRNVYLMTTAQRYQDMLTDAIRYITEFYLPLMLIIAYAGAMIVALGGFRYLYHKRMVDLYHSAPLSRKKLFLSVWLSGFLIWLIPSLFNTLLVFPVIVYFMKGTFFATIFVNLMLGMLRLCLCFLIVYNACLVAVMLAGNVLNAIVGSLSYGFLLAMGLIAFQVMEETFFRSSLIPRAFMYTHPLYVLSPLTTPFILAYEWVQSFDFLGFYYWHLLAGILIMVINFVAAFVLYQRRPSELSERGIESKPVRITLRALLSFVGGVGFTLILYAVSNHRFGWMLFGAFFGSAVTFCVTNVIFHGTFKEAFSHKLQYLFVFLGCVLLFAVMIFDLTGFEKRLPKESSISGISVCVDIMTENADWKFTNENGKLVKGAYENGIPSEIQCTDPGQIHKLLSACVNRKDYGYGALALGVKVQTKWGSYFRRYYLSMEDIDLLKPMVETKEYAEHYYPIRTQRYGIPEKISLVSSFNKDEVIEDSDRIQQLMNAFRTDFEAHNDIRNLLRDSRVFSLSFTYLSGEGYYYSFTQTVPYWYENTVKLIESWYPKKVWDPVLEDVDYVNVCGSIPLPDNHFSRERLYQYFGYDIEGKPLASPSENPYMRYATSSVYENWNYIVDDVAFLEEIKSDLIWGLYEDELTNEYVFLGWAYLESGGSVDCYVRYGSLPLKVLEQILENSTVLDYSRDYEYYEEVEPVTEPIFYYD